MKAIFTFIFLLFASVAQGQQTIYSRMNAETGNLSQWSAAIKSSVGTGSSLPVASQTIVKNGSWSFKYEEPNPNVAVCCEWNYSMNLSYSPNLTGMGGKNGRYTSGYYSFWLYIDAGFTGEVYQDWRTILNWFGSAGATLGPILNLELHGGNPTTGGNALQLSVLLKNAQSGCYTAPTIPNYSMTGNGYYFQTSTSPAGIVTFPTGQWVHIETQFTAATTNGNFKVWQNGVKIFDLTAPTFNTTMSNNTCAAGNGDMIIQFGMYNGARTGIAQRMYMDDFLVTNYQVYPTLPGSLVNWTNGRGDSGTGPVVAPNWTITNMPLRPGLNPVTVTDPVTQAADNIVITYVPSFPGNTLAGAWPFNEVSGTALDATVNGNNGNLINGATRAPGNHAPDQAVLLNPAQSQYVNVQSSSTLDFTRSFTFSAWVNVGGVHSDYRPIIVKNTMIALEASENQYCPASGRPMIWFQSNGIVGPQYYACGSLPLNPGQWYHLAGTYDGGSVTPTLKLYINGVLDGSYVVGSTQYIEPSTGALMIGHDSSPSGGYFDGMIASPRVRNFGVQQEGTLNTIASINKGCTALQYAESISAPSVIGDLNCSIATPVPPLAFKFPASATGLNIGAGTNLMLGTTP